MNRLILADNQAIFRAGAARVLALEDDMRIVAQVDDVPRLWAAMEAHHDATIIFSAGLRLELGSFLAKVAAADSRAILVTENGETCTNPEAGKLHGIISRSITGPDLIECVRKVRRGHRFVQQANLMTMQAPDKVGERVRNRLTPKELQIVALIVQGCKNKDIATQLTTKEQVIKNYLRSIYDKTGVSDRLELALFTIHHRILAEAAAKAGTLLQMKSA